MVVIAVGVGEEKIEFSIHKKLLNSVTDIFAENPATLNNRWELDMDMDIKVFQSFLAWLYKGNRGQQLKAQGHKSKALLQLYALSIYLKCKSLKSDSFYALLSAISEDANDFIETVDVMFQRYPQPSKDFSALQIMLDKITQLASIDLHSINTLLEIYVKTIKWGNNNWENCVINSIQDELEDRGAVLTFDQIKMIFDSTKERGCGDQLRSFCVALTYYQRDWREGPIKDSQHLKAGAMTRLYQGIEGFMTAYLEFEDFHGVFYPGEHPKDPRDRTGAMGTCFFHIHEPGESCTPSTEIEE